MPTRLIYAAPAALVFAALALSAPARADLKLVQKATTSGTGMAAAQGNSAGTVTSTSYYKGNKVRREQGGTVTLYDGTTKKLLVLNPAKKTYTVVSGQEAGGAMASVRLETTAATFAPGGQTRTIGGKPAKNYLVKGTLSMQPPAGASAKPNRQRFTMQMDTELWTTESVKGVATTQAAPEINSLGAMGAGMKPLLDKFAQVKGVTLASTQKMTMGMSASASSGASTMGTSTLRTELVSLSEAPLPDSLFTVPKGYTLSKTAPRPRPANPMRPALRNTP